MEPNRTEDASASLTIRTGAVIADVVAPLHFPSWSSDPLIVRAEALLRLPFPDNGKRRRRVGFFGPQEPLCSGSSEDKGP